MNEAERYLQARSGHARNVSMSHEHPVDGIRSSADHSKASAGKLISLSLASGVFGFICAFLRELGAVIPEWMAIIFLAPPIEEILKIALPIIVLEHRTRWIHRGQELLWFAMGSALVFAVVENLVYTFVYLEDPSAGLLWWRWGVCTAMHVGASALSGVGLMRAYKRGIKTNVRPRFIWEWPWLAGAIAIHLVYNSIIVFAEFI